MIPPKRAKIENNVGGALFEELFTEFLKTKYGITPTHLDRLISEKNSLNQSIPLSILRSKKLSSLEAIVKFLRENRKLSYNEIGKLLYRKPKTLAVTYAVAIRKMPGYFEEGIDTDIHRIPFTIFSNKLSVLETICTYLKSLDNSYAQISRMLDKNQRTVWTVCKRAELKSKRKYVGV